MTRPRPVMASSSPCFTSAKVPFTEWTTRKSGSAAWVQGARQRRIVSRAKQRWIMADLGKGSGVDRHRRRQLPYKN